MAELCVAVNSEYTASLRERLAARYNISLEGMTQ